MLRPSLSDTSMRLECHWSTDATGRTLQSTSSQSEAVRHPSSRRQKSRLLSDDHDTYRRLRPRCVQKSLTITLSSSPIDIFQLGEVPQSGLPTVVSSIFSFASGSAICSVTPQLIAKFGLPAGPSQAQTVVSVTNKITQQQAWFNRDRTRKPQLFQQADTLVDPTAVKQHCDFCQWQDYTASDVFGRIETEHTVTASNLFKYCEPCHGLVLLKHHSPLEFSQQQVSELLSSAWEWFRESHRHHSDALHPFFLWNCLPRAGASQFHGHAQVMLSKVALPCHSQAAAAQGQFEAAGLGPGSYDDAVLNAHRDLGLVSHVGPSNDRAYCYASITPVKDMETVVQGHSLTSPAFQAVLHAALRTLIDNLGVRTFNVGISGIESFSSSPAGSGSTSTVGSSSGRITARIISRGKLSNQASDFGGLEVFGGASIGHTDPFFVAKTLQETMCDLQLCR